MNAPSEKSPNFNPLVSILIPAYNAAPFIGEALRSIQAQSYAHFEAIIVDDGSRDETASVVQDFAAADARFKLLRQPNRGTSAARNAALSMAQGRLIAFLDADDVWLPEKLSRQVEQFHRLPEINFSYTNYYFWDGAKTAGLRYFKPKNFPPRRPQIKIIYTCPFIPSAVVVRRETLDLVGGFDETVSLVEDWDLWLRIAEAGMEAHCIREPMFYYRQHSGNLSGDAIKMAEGGIHVLKKNLKVTGDRYKVRHFHRALQKVRCHHLELVRGRQVLETDAPTATSALLRAWRKDWRQIKWLLRWLLAVWPHILGGEFTAACVHRKLRQKF